MRGHRLQQIDVTYRCEDSARAYRNIRHYSRELLGTLATTFSFTARWLLKSGFTVSSTWLHLTVQPQRATRKCLTGSYPSRYRMKRRVFELHE